MYVTMTKLVLVMLLNVQHKSIMYSGTPLKWTPLGLLPRVWNIDAFVILGLPVYFWYTWQCVLGLLSMMKPHFRTSLMLYDGEKG